MQIALRQRRVLHWLLSAAILFWTANATAEDLSVLMLNHICTSTNAGDKSACSGFLVGFIGGLREGTKASAEGKPICPPNSFSPEHLKLILDKIVHEGPQYASLPALPAIAVALQAAFPCSQIK